MKFILTGVVLTVAIVGISVAVDVQSRPSTERPPSDGAARLICAQAGSKARRKRSSCGPSLPAGS